MSRAVRAYALLFSLLVPVSSAFASGGTLYLSPISGSHAVGEQFDVHLYVDTGGAGVSAAEAELSFDPSILSVVQISSENSILGSWPTPPAFSNTAGTITFTGWASQYYAGPSGLLVTVRFTALRTAAATTLHVVSGTILPAGENDSNIVTSMRAATVSIVAPEIVPVPPASPAPVRILIQQPPPSSPTLVAPPTIRAGTDIIVRGSAEPGATVHLWLQKDGDSPVHSMLTAGPAGSFTFVSDTPAQPGTYSLWAQTEAADGQKSALSQKLTMTIGGQDLVASVFAAHAAGGFLPYLISLIVIAFGATYVARYRTRTGGR